MYEILPHTADVRVRLTCNDAPSLFADGAAALRDVVKPEVVPGQGETHSLSIEAHDLTSLLVDFLNELVWLLEVRHLVSSSVSVTTLEPTRLVAALTMAEVATWQRDVKAVTYHEAEVREADGEWTTTLVLDI
jgi:SHS2 domain-containing protein